ncbi:MAG: hypothetical protein EON96_10375 [Caulobacteraceae bacterium]|nr:MAG: hypothetical protein EON96_10375 [Caulobacteraceae bacterium]
MSNLVAPLNAALAQGQRATTVDAAMIAKLTDMAGDFAINLSIALLILVVTIFISRWAAGVTRRYFIWGAIVWGKGTSPALQVLGMRAIKEETGRPATWGTMALRNIVGGILQGILSIITGLISFIMFLTDEPRHRTIPDRIGGTIIVHDPNKVLG